MAFDAGDKTPNPVDTYVGGRIRMRRRALGMSQSELGDTFSLTFQQVQKYERGSNRVSASKLYEIARALKVPVSYFFEGLSDPSDATAYDNPPDTTVHEFLTTNEGMELAAVFPKVKKPRLRRRILDLVRTMAQEDDALDEV